MKDASEAINALNAAVRVLNAGPCSSPAMAALRAALRQLGTPDDKLDTALNQLVVYGTLAPGRPNHHVVADVAGKWSTGWVEGDLHDHGWGAAEGYPAMVWRPGAERIDVNVLESAELPQHWRRLDEFEGDGYRRVRIPVFRDDAPPTVGHIYEARFLPPLAP